MPDNAPSRWSVLVKLHIPFALAVAWCLFAGWFELNRARAGRDVAWVYAVEWPLFAILGTGIWWQQLHGRSPRRVVRDDSQTPGQLDTGLVAWQEYLGRLQAADPPGGPSGGTVNARPVAPDSPRRPRERER